MQRSFLFPYGGFASVLRPVHSHVRYSCERSSVRDMVRMYDAKMISAVPDQHR